MVRLYASVRRSASHICNVAPSMVGRFGEGIIHGLKLVDVAVSAQAVWHTARVCVRTAAGSPLRSPRSPCSVF